VHYWLLELKADGTFEQTFPNTPADRVIGTYAVETGALSATVAYDEGYQSVEQTVEGTVTFEEDGDSTGTTTATTTDLDGFVEVAEHATALTGCERTLAFSFTDRDDEVVAGTIETIFTGAMTADETVEATLGEDLSVTYDSALHDDYSRTDEMTIDDATTEPSPDQIAERTMAGDGTGYGTYTAHRDDGGTQEGDWTYLANGDQTGSWEMSFPDAPYDPFAWGATTHYLDGAGESDYTRMTMQGEEVACHSEWDADGAGFTECDDGTYETF